MRKSAPPFGRSEKRDCANRAQHRQRGGRALKAEERKKDALEQHWTKRKRTRTRKRKRGSKRKQERSTMLTQQRSHGETASWLRLWLWLWTRPAA